MNGAFASSASVPFCFLPDVDLQYTDPAAEAGRMIIRQLLAPAKEVAALLDVVSEIHPAVAVSLSLYEVDSPADEEAHFQAVAGIFKVVIQMELDHNENHAKVAVLHFSLVRLLCLWSCREAPPNDICLIRRTCFSLSVI